MEMVPRVSIIMPVYNASQYLKEAIDSILKQTFIDFEFIIVNDGSTDDSANIIGSYSDKRIKLFNNDGNKGIVYTLNAAIRFASCPIIARMDADDISFPERIELQYNYLTSNPDCALVCSWIELMSENGKPICVQDRYNRYLYYDLIYKCVIPHPTVMFRKDIIADFDCYVRKHAEDFDLWSKVARKHAVHKIDRELLHYRFSNTSISNITLKKEYLYETKEVVKNNIQNIIGQEDLKDEIIECYMDNFEPIRKINKFEIYRECLSVLNRINRAFINIDNPNKNLNHIKEAAFNKKLFIYNNIKNYISRFNRLTLLITTNSWDIFFYVSKQKVKSILQ